MKKTVNKNMTLWAEKIKFVIKSKTKIKQNLSDEGCTDFVVYCS